MSRKNVEILRRTLERMGSEPEAFWAILDPEVEWAQTQQLPDAEVVRGYDAVRHATRRWLGTFDDYSRDLEELIDAGDDVITVLRLRGKGREAARPSRVESHRSGPSATGRLCGTEASPRGRTL